MKADIFKIRVNTLIGTVILGSFASYWGYLIWHAASTLPYGILPAGF